MDGKYYVAMFDSDLENEYERFPSDIEAIRGFLEFADANDETILEIHQCADDECLTPCRRIYPLYYK